MPAKDKKYAKRNLVVPFHVKAVEDPASHTFEGLVAVIGQKDLGNDIIEPGAFTKTLANWKKSGDALPLLNSHNQYDIFSAVGQLIAAKEQSDGLWTKWEVVPGAKGDEVMQLLTPSKITGKPIVGKMSIGYVPVKFEYEQPEGTTSFWDQIRHLNEVDLKEGSLVLFPMAPGAAIDASTVKSFLLSAQMTEAKSLDVVAKSELRKLASRIGILLAKGAAATEEDEEAKGKKPKKPAAAAADETATPPAETYSQNDDPDAPTPGTPEDEVDDPILDIMAANIDEDTDNPDDPDQGDDLDDDPASETPATPKKKKGAKKDDESEAERAAAPYVFQEALAQRLQKTLLQHRISSAKA